MRNSKKLLAFLSAQGVGETTVKAVATELQRHTLSRHLDWLRKHYSHLNWWYVGWRGAQATFEVEHVNLNERESILAYVHAHGLKLSKWEKQGEVNSKGEAETRLTAFALDKWHGVVLRHKFRYTRPGLPSRTCRVNTNVYHTVVCDIASS